MQKSCIEERSSKFESENANRGTWKTDYEDRQKLKGIAEKIFQESVQANKHKEAIRNGYDQCSNSSIIINKINTKNF